MERNHIVNQTGLACSSHSNSFAIYVHILKCYCSDCWRRPSVASHLLKIVAVARNFLTDCFFLPSNVFFLNYFLIYIFIVFMRCIKNNFLFFKYYFNIFSNKIILLKIKFFPTSNRLWLTRSKSVIYVKYMFNLKLIRKTF